MIDLKYLNQFFEFQKVKFENLAVLKNVDASANYAFSVDISDAYHHLRLSPLIEHLF